MESLHVPECAPPVAVSGDTNTCTATVSSERVPQQHTYIRSPTTTAAAAVAATTATTTTPIAT
jgi:hypothetical protein